MLLENFITSQGKNCVLGSVSNIAAYYGLRIKEEDLFFWFSPFDGDKNLQEVFAAMYENNGDRPWLEFVNEQVHMGNPVTVSIDDKTLPYIDMQVGDNSAKHCINMIGTELDKVYVSDGYVPRYIPTVHEGWVELNDIKDECVFCCHSMRSEIIDFLSKSEEEQTINYSVKMSLHRIDDFLNHKNEQSGMTGMEETEQLSITVKEDIMKENYDSVFRFLAVLRLNVINPLVYLDDLYLRIGRDDSRLKEVVNTKWEKINTKLIKFALARKRTDAEQISAMINEAAGLEREVLNEFLRQVLPCDAEGFEQFFRQYDK